MDWFVLGIEPTKDKKAITAAYRQKLRRTNPEDQPEEFKALRAAYEEALALADQEETPQIQDGSPVGRWMEKVKAVYNDFPARIAEENWRRLVNEDVCQALDTRPQAEEGLLRFLMENYFLPREVWMVLDEAFHFTQRVTELSEVFPREFLEHIILNGIRLEDDPPYDLFEPGVNSRDCDAYCKLYYQARRGDPSTLGITLEQMDALSERHPYGEVIRMYHWMANGRKEEGRAGLQKLAQEYPERAGVVLAWTSICLEDGDPAQARVMAERILKKQPQNVAAMSTTARAMAAMGDYADAKEMIYDAIHACSGDPIFINDMMEQMRVWNESLILQLEEKLTACPEAWNTAVDLAWCYAQNDCTERAMEIAEKIDEQKADAFLYHNLVGKLLYNQEQFSEAMEHLEILVRLVRDMEPDGTAETDKKIRRLPEMLQLLGNCIMQTGRYDEAREKYREALAITPNDTELLSVMGRNLYAMGDYSYAVEILNSLLRTAPELWHPELLLALCLYHLNRDGEAYEAVERGLAMQSNDLSLYVLKMQILIRNGVWEGVHDILDFLEENGAPADLSTDFIRAKVEELEKKDTKEAFRRYQKIARAVEAGELMIWASELYCRMGVLMSADMDPSQEEDRDILMATVDKGLQHNPGDADCICFKAWLMRRGSMIREAIDMYLELEQKDPDSALVHQGLSDLYYDYVYLYTEEALAYFVKRWAVQKTPRNCYYLATCWSTLGDFEQAREYFGMVLEMDPEDLDAYHGLAAVADREKDYVKAIEFLDKAIAIIEGSGRCPDWLLEYKVRMLRRLGRVEDALAMVDDVMEKYGYDGFRMKFDICCQFGLWGRANSVLDAWKLAMGKDPRRTAAAAQLALLTGNLFKASVLMGTVKHKLDPNQILAFRLQLNDLECRHDRQVMHMGPRLKQDPRDDNAQLCMAQALWHSGQREAAQRCAEAALVLIDEMLQYHIADEVLFRTRRCLALAMLGREEEARAELARSRKLPMCPFCEYGSCKDADIYEAMIEEILGNTDRALALFCAGKEKWPDDTDFSAGIARLTKRGKKKC